MSAIFSMTGYGYSTAKRGGAVVNAEIRSVNSRYLDLNLRMPKTLNHLEPQIREMIRSEVTRGRLDVFLALEHGSESIGTVSVDERLAAKMAKAMRKMAGKLDLDDDVTVDMIARQPGVINVSERSEATETEQKAAEMALQKALRKLVQSRRAEGRALSQDVAGRAKDIASILNQISAGLPEAQEQMNDRLKRRVTESSKRLDLDPMRFEMEIAYLVARSDVSEELTRLQSHLEQIRQTLKRGGVCGRNLDFLIQECLREIGTLSAKTQALEITKLALDVKSELEKMREQVQNIE